MDAFEKLIRVSITPDRLEAGVSIQPGLDAAFLTAELVNSLLDQQGILRAKDRDDAVAELIQRAHAAGDATVETVVAKGTPATHGESGRFELSAAAEPSQPTDPAAATPAVEGTDHYNRCAFQIVLKGDLVGTLHPPVEGKDGTDVTGKTIAARSGLSAPVRFDETVTVLKNGAVHAVVSGNVVLKNSCLRIVDTLEVDNYIDFSTGNIDFPGHVKVAKGVRDCFVVRTGRDLTVHDLVEAAQLEVGEDAHLNRGMAAREKGGLTVGRDLRTKYLDNVEVQVGRDAFITKETANCQISVGRKFMGPTCAVVGGDLACLEGEVAQLGTRAGVTTSLALGRVKELEEKARQFLAAVVPMKKRVEGLQQAYDQLRRSAPKPNAAQAEQLTEAQFELSTQRDRLAKLTRGLEAYLSVIATHCKGTLQVHRLLCPGVKLWMGSYRVEISKEIAGPLRLALDERGQPTLTMISSGNTSPLSQHARVIQDDRFVDVAKIRKDCDLPMAA